MGSVRAFALMGEISRIFCSSSESWLEMRASISPKSSHTQRRDPPKKPHHRHVLHPFQETDEVLRGFGRELDVVYVDADRDVAAPLPCGATGHVETTTLRWSRMTLIPCAR
jgi:hypothetical protein